MTEEVTPVEEAPKPKLTPKAQAEQLLNHMLKGKQVHEIFADNLRRQLPISGKSMEHWEEKFKIRIPVDSLTPTLCKELSIRLLGLHEEATFHHAVATAKSQMIKRGSEAAFNSKFQTIVAEHKAKHKRLPGQETLRTMASIDNEEIDSAQSIAETERLYWRGILDHLYMCRKLLETASMNIAVELKAIRNDEAIERLAQFGGSNGH